MIEALSYDDVLIRPKFSRIKSRADVSLTQRFLGTKLDLPIISSSMDTITDYKMAAAMFNAGGLGCLHRFMTIEENVAQYLKSPEETMCAVGLGKYEYDRAAALVSAGCTRILIDVAHGAMLSVVEQYEMLREGIRPIYIVVGNFADSNSIWWFEHELKRDTQLPDMYKVGVGPGSVCTTREVTGCGLPVLASLLEIRATFPDVALIADGGITKSGDIAKALAAGASAVMCGFILAGTDEACGKEISKLINCHTKDGSGFQDILIAKEYRGSASAESYVVQGKTAEHRAPEGETMQVPYRGPVTPILKKLAAGLASSLTYTGSKSILDFHKNATLVRITGAGIREGGCHGKRDL